MVTPSTLTQNWADEARKWLGNERMRVLVLQPGADGKQQVGCLALRELPGVRLAGRLWSWLHIYVPACGTHP